jgi:7-carboxy-7-deazaguanine synthase
MTITDAAPGAALWKAPRDWLLVSETFTTLQGEGPSAGQFAHFIRLGGCNLHCRWCDTPYTWAFDKRHADFHDSGKQYNPTTELRMVTITDLVQEILETYPPLCVITGGEPMLQYDQLYEVIRQVSEQSETRFEIETAGTVPPGNLMNAGTVDFNVSPKLQDSGNPLSKRYLPNVLKLLEQAGAIFKFVIPPPPDSRDALKEVERIQDECAIPDYRMWLMPCGTTQDEVLRGIRGLAPVAIKNGWNVSTRLHVEIWGDKRGV